MKSEIFQKWFILCSLVMLISLVPIFAFDTQSAYTDNSVTESADEILIHYFYQRGCPFCTMQEEVFAELLANTDHVTIQKYDITQRQSLQILDALSEERNITVSRIGVPLFFVGDEMFMGYNPQITELFNISEEIIDSTVKSNQSQSHNLIMLPVIGEIQPTTYSFFTLAFLIGTLDGLNVCSIGALLLILSIVISLNSRRKILLYGGVFILTTAVVYGLLVFSWFGILRTVFSYLQFLQILIGVAGLAGGSYFLFKFLQFIKFGPACNVTTNKRIVALQQKLLHFIQNPQNSLFVIMSAIVGFAVIITIVELPCSFTLPLIFAGVLADFEVPLFASFLYILAYLFFYMLIEIIIFLIAVYTKKLWYGPQKIVTWMTLAAAIIMFLFGLYYLAPFIPFI